MMSSDSGPYDPRKTGETLTMENVSLMPNWLGFNAVWAMGLVVVCILLLVPSVGLFYVLPWQVGVITLLSTLVFDVLLLASALVTSIVTPSHEGTLQYLRSRYAEFRGRKSIRSDSKLPSHTDR